MTRNGGEAPQQARPKRSRVRRNWGCIAAFAILAPIGLFVGYAILLSFSFRECNPPQRIENESAASTVTLDAGHPIVQQHITVHIPAVGLPDQSRADAVSLSIDRAATPPAPGPRRSGSPSSASAAPSASAEAASGLLVAFVSEDTGEVVARISTPAPSTGSGPVPLATIPLDCEVARDCDRAFRVVISLSNGAVEQAGSLTWTARATITWGYVDCAGPPYTARPTVKVDPAVAEAPDQLVTAELPIRSDSATILARHVTISTASAPDAAYGHLFIRPSNVPWVPWLRIVADGGDPPIFDAPLGQPYSLAGEQLVDFPILAGCPRGSACRRGYWLLIQAMPSARLGADLGWSVEPKVGSTDWQLGAIGAGSGGDGGAGPIELVIDDEPPDLGPSPMLETDTIRMDLQPDIERFVEVMLHVPGPIQAASGLDAARSAYVIADVSGFGVAHGYYLEGDGPGPFRGGANGDSNATLIAHPFDDCPAAGPCDVVVRLVGVLTPDPHSSMSGTPNVMARLAVLGAPVGTTATIGAVHDRPRSADAGGSTGVPVPLLILVLGVIAFIAGLLVRDAGRRYRRRPRAG